MKRLIIFFLCLSGSTVAFAQTGSPRIQSTTAPGPTQPTLTAADSARESARQLNALQLRRQAMAAPKLLPTTSSTTQRHIGSGEAVDATELDNRAQVRNQQEQQMIATTLAPKKARKAAAKAAASAETSENDKIRRSK